jgi:hypothetical protein
MLRDSSVRERNGLMKGKTKDLRGSVDTFFASQISDVEVFSHLEGVHLDIDPRVLWVKNGAAG